jgi:phosphoadenosine phosphosulfate reductase
MTQQQTKTYTPQDLVKLSTELEEWSPQEILQWAVAEFFPDLTMACSFGGPSGMVLVDMISKIEPRVEVFYLDTDFLFPDTYALRDQVAATYNISPVAYKSLLTPDEQTASYGSELWARDPDLCCQLRKVEPNARALAGRRAWVSGLRRDQGASRRDTPIVQWDEKFALVKINALARWLEADVWAYIVKNDVPYNPLHDQSYPSVSCTYCTKPVKAGEDLRAGRWQGFDKDECGLHDSGGVIELVRGEEETG